MPFLPAELSTFLPYAVPPVLGGFIGYLTTKVAIKMLFLPLRPWHLFGLRIPMTPGVIPSKRHQLADNMGEVVGDHLLTSKEIGNALTEEKFQQHLLNVIAERIGAILHRPLPPVLELIPEKFSFYRQLGVMALKKQLRDQVGTFLTSREFSAALTETLEARADSLLEKRIDELIDREGRGRAYAFLDDALTRMLSSTTMEPWLRKSIRQHVFSALNQQKTIREVAPASILDLIEQSIRSQTPILLKKLAGLLEEEEVRNSIVHGTCNGVQNFILSLGPMAPMVQNFLSMDLVDQKIREYLDEKQEEIVAYLSKDELQQRVGEILSDRFSAFIDRPLAKLFSGKDEQTVEDFCSHLAHQAALLLKGDEVRSTLMKIVRENIESHLEDGNLSVGVAVLELLGNEGCEKLRTRLITELVSLAQKSETQAMVGEMLDRLVDRVLAKPIGKLANFLPTDVRREIYVSIQQITSNMLAQEVPGLVASLNIRNIIVEKINSLDLLRLERLLLSIMEEQFKYINLFGALLGFLIGCLNLLFLQAGSL